MNQDPQSSENAGLRRWPKVLLAVSLVFNFLVIGAVVGANLRHDDDMRRPAPADREMMRETGFAPFIDALPREARREIGARLRAEAGGMRPDRTALEAEFTAILTSLRAEPFDPAALAGVLAAQQDRVSHRIEAGRRVLVESLAQMSPAERAAFADQLEKRLRHGPARR